MREKLPWELPMRVQGDFSELVGLLICSKSFSDQMKLIMLTDIVL